ncbi:Ig-like domain-containing protein [Candidatus Gracilibacteria bacterium]|nr:Ig-like domain-containing protein [Candidatus Gracilibacteria bacterium]
MNKKINILFALFLPFLLFGGVASVSAGNPSIHIQDSFSGEETIAKIYGLFPHEPFSFSLLRPNNSRIAFSSEADENGRKQLSIPGLHLQKSGTYQAQIVRDTGTESTFFQILPGPVSAYRSSLTVEHPSIPANGKATSLITLTLLDAFGNPIEGKQASLFSSRNQDRIQSLTPSNDAGIIQTHIASDVPGVSVVSAVVDSIVLFEKPEVVFHLSDQTFPFVGADGEETWGQYLKAQLFDNQNAAEVSYFSFENINTEATIGKTFTAKITARDENGDIAPSYRGTIRFSSSDPQADLPSDYQFTTDDQGEHSFFLAFAFQTPGEQTLAVHDLGDFRISGEAEFTVGLGGGNVPIPNTDQSLELLTPRPGVYRLSRVTITGSAVNCPTVKIIDGETVLVPELQVDPRGNFLLQTPRLGDGVHVFQAICVANPDIASNELSIRIDQSPPEGISVRVEPEGSLQKGASFRVLVTGDEPLSGAQSIFQGVLTQHSNEGTVWSADLSAPLQCGEFPIDVTALDLIGNEKEFPAAGLIQVIGCENDPENPPSDSPPETGGDSEAKDTIPPTAVENLSPQSGDGRVTLLWSPADDNEGIKNYRVEFGCRAIGSETEITLDRSNTTPDKRTQWYVDEMAPDEECDFRVIPIDNAGNEGPAGATVRAMTAEGEAMLHASAPKKLEKTGGSSNLVFLFAILTGLGVLVVSRKMKRG